MNEGEEASEGVWYAYFEKQDPTTPVSQTYVDTMNPLAIREFARVTYDLYKKEVGEYFGNVSPAIFTDEPQYASESALRFAGEKEDVILPWTDTFAETYAQAYSEDILDFLPELVSTCRAARSHGTATSTTTTWRSASSARSATRSETGAKKTESCLPGT